MRDLRTPRISPAQMICLLVLSRLFIVLIFIPDANGSSQGSASLLAIVLGFVLTAAAIFTSISIREIRRSSISTAPTIRATVGAVLPPTMSE